MFVLFGYTFTRTRRKLVNSGLSGGGVDPFDSTSKGQLKGCSIGENDIIHRLHGRTWTLWEVGGNGHGI